MPSKCNVYNCKGNYYAHTKCRVFKLPRDELQRQSWINKIPERLHFKIDDDKYHICEKHWPPGYRVKKIAGGSTVPVDPPSVFDVPKSTLPSPKPLPRPEKVKDVQLAYFNKKDRVNSLKSLNPERFLKKNYAEDNNLIFSQTDTHFVCLFMSADFSHTKLSIVVEEHSTLTCNLTLHIYKNGHRVPLGKLLKPNNGLDSKTQFEECVHAAILFEPPCECVIKEALDILKQHSYSSDVTKKERKLLFLTHQLELLANKQFTTKDYCFAIECFPRCVYEQLRDYLVLPSERKLQSVMSATELESVLVKTISKLSLEQQKYGFLLVDEVKVRATVAFTCGMLCGMARNDDTHRATSMLCIMLKLLHGGPSVMISVIPVHGLTSPYQYKAVIDAAIVVEKTGFFVLGSINDNHKVNQQYCSLFMKIEMDDPSHAVVQHPLDYRRVWFLLYDTVHLLKCIRNNWITEKTKRFQLAGQSVASFSDVVQLYNDEKDSILKTSPLTNSSVKPSKLQLQNVQHVLNVFNEKVVAALKLRKCDGTANFVETILNWWKIVNVSGKGQDKRFNDPYRAVQMKDSTSLGTFLDIFKKTPSGQGKKRVKCFTHDTKKALVHTMEGLMAVCAYLIEHAQFDYVVLRELQSDRLEGEFGVYRQSTGANNFMTCGDVFIANKRRLTRFAASFLESIETDPAVVQHICIGDLVREDGLTIEECTAGVTLTSDEESSSAYVAGWLESKCVKDGHQHFLGEDEEPLVESEVKDFIIEVSRGKLTVPHASTFHLVRLGHFFVKKTRERACCRRRLMDILSALGGFNDIFVCNNMLKRLSNVLLHGLHKLEKDHQKNAKLMQTSVKKARMA